MKSSSQSTDHTAKLGSSVTRTHDSYLALIAGLATLTFGLERSHGSPDVGTLLPLPISLLFFALAFVPDFRSSVDWKRLLRLATYSLPILFFIAGGLFFKPNPYVPPAVIYSEPLLESLITLAQYTQYLAAVAATTCLIAAWQNRPRLAEISFQLTVLIAGAIALLVITAEPRPWIDVWTVQESATKDLLNFQSAYNVDSFNLYPKYLRDLLTPYGGIFVYMPGVIYLMAPFKAIGLDTRVALILSHVLAALSLNWIAKGAGWTGARRYLPALLFISIPFVPFMLSMAWNDVFTVLFIPLMALALQRKNTQLFVASFIGAAMIKAHIAICFPLLFWVAYQKIGFKFWRTLAMIFGGVFILCLPFLLAGWRNFLGSLYGLHFIKYDPRPQLIVRSDSYSLYKWLSEIFDSTPAGTFAIAGGITLLLSFWLWKSVPTTARVMALAGLILMNTFAFANASFINYYWVPIAFFVVALACLSPRDELVSP